MPTTWRAPGRVNLIGEHVDYNDGLVLPFALPMATSATVRRTGGGQVVVRSSAQQGQAEFAADTEPGDVKGWAAYVAGVVWAMTPGTTPLPGMAIAIHSDVPAGAGLSSSAALECSVATAVNDELDLGLDRAALVAATRRAENDYVGLPNGGMDQAASLLCRAGHALLLDCRSNATEQVPLALDDAGLRLLVVDTRAHHALTDGGYAQRQRECEQAAAALDVPALRDATLEAVQRLPDPVLRRRAHHVVSEIDRVRAVVALLRAGHPEQAGAFLTASHQSLAEDFEVSSAELDAVVDTAMAAGALGARMTGGGFGGSAIVLLRRGDVERVTGAVVAAFADAGWIAPHVWTAAAGDGAHRVSR